MESQAGAHESPAQSRAVNDGCIQFTGVGHAIVDQVQDLPPQGLLQAVGEETFDLGTYPQRVHTQVGVERGGAVDSLRCRLFPSQHLDQRQQVHRVEGVPDDNPFRPAAAGLEFGRQQP